jgi:hypothetical protein
VANYWCCNCTEWYSLDDSFSFFAPRCEECGTFLEEECQPEHTIIDHKEVDVSWAFGPKDEEDSDDSDDSDADGDSDGDGDGDG